MNSQHAPGKKFKVIAIGNSIIVKEFDLYILIGCKLLRIKIDRKYNPKQH